MGSRIPLDDLALERAAARLYALRFDNLDEGRAAWERLLPSRREAVREEVRFAHLWFQAIADNMMGAPALDPRIPALLCPRSTVRRWFSDESPAIPATASAADVDKNVRDRSI